MGGAGRRSAILPRFCEDDLTVEVLGSEENLTARVEALLLPERRELTAAKEEE